MVERPKLTDCRRRQRWSGKETMKSKVKPERDERGGSSGGAHGSANTVELIGAGICDACGEHAEQLIAINQRGGRGVTAIAGLCSCQKCAGSSWPNAAHQQPPPTTQKTGGTPDCPTCAVAITHAAHDEVVTNYVLGFWHGTNAVELLTAEKH